MTLSDDGSRLPTTRIETVPALRPVVKAVLASVVLAAGLFAGAGASANTGPVATPVAMMFFCQQNPAECVAGGRSQVAMTDELATLLVGVNRRVNAAIRYRAERVDMWSLDPASGDCEDFVLSKRSALIKAGVPAGALRIAFTHTRRDEPHAVLVVKSSLGDYVLDNFSDQVTSLSASGYDIVMLSGADPMHWTRG